MKKGEKNNMPVRQIGLPASGYRDPLDHILRDLTPEEIQWAFRFEGTGYWHLSLAADILRDRNDEVSRQVIEDKQNIWFINHQDNVLLSLYGYDKGARTQIHQRINQLRATGRYTKEFRWYNNDHDD